MNYEFPSITTLIPDLKDGDSAAWNNLVQLFEAGLLGKARRLLNNSHLERRIDPEELVNISLTKAWEKHHQIAAQSTRQIAAFLLTVIRNSFIDLCRPKSIEESSPSWLVPSADNHSPSEILMSQEDEIRLHACLAELPQRQREILVMRHFDGMKFKEIAHALGTTTGSVAGAARDGLKILSSRFEPEEGN